MGGWPDDDANPVPTPAQLLDEIVVGHYGDTNAALARVTALVDHPGAADDPDLLLTTFYARIVLQLACGQPTAPASAAADCDAACDRLERAAHDLEVPIWGAVACALRAGLRLDAGDVGAAMGQLGRVDLDQLADELPGPAGAALLEGLADVYSRLRLHDQVDVVRALAKNSLDDRPPPARAVHWARAATELAVRGMETLASGGDEPDLHLLARAVTEANGLSTVPPDLIPDRLRRGADGVRALSAAYHGRPEEALRLLGDDAFEQPADLPPLERQLTTLAAIHAHVLDGGTAIARALDDGAEAPSPSLNHLLLEVCRARERLALESRAGGDAIPVITRLSGLLARLAWHGMDLMAGAASQALEHQALRVESRTDALTGVGNRRALDEELRNLLRFSPLPLSLVLVDVDEFKAVNDRFTHVAGDEVLRRVADALREQLRTGDRLVRYGGDEFVVLLPLTSDVEADALAVRLGAAVRRLHWHDVSEGLTVAVTTGSATLWALSHRRPDEDAEHLFRQADEQLLRAKRRRGSASAGSRGRRVASAAPLGPPSVASPSLLSPSPAVSARPSDPALPPLSPQPSDPVQQAFSPQPADPPPADPPPAGPARPADPLVDPLPRPSAEPLSPGHGLPLYRALLNNPPRVDPYLGPLSPADPAESTLTPLGLVLPSLRRPGLPSATGGPSAAGGPPAVNGRGAAHPHDGPGANDRSDPDAPGGGEAEQRPTRPRRRPTIIDLTGDDDRHPFG